jgi:putative oxidoreductase
VHRFFDRLAPLFNVAARLLMACIFIVSGWAKIEHYAGAQRFVESLGLPGALMPAIILVELGGSLALAVGYQTRLAAFLLAGFSLTAGSLVHLHPGDHEHMIVFMDNLAMAGGLLLFVQYGGGAFSLDRRLQRR